jgi:ATP citrate (pro-S)-lyase
LDFVLKKSLTLSLLLKPQVTKSTDFNKLADEEPWLNATRLVVKPDMLFGKRGKSGLVR